MKVSIITAIYDDYDTIKPVCHQYGVTVEWILVTDNPPDLNAAEGWAIIEEKRPEVHPNLAAKRPKMLPWEYTTFDNSIWIDASFQVTSEYFAIEAMRYANPIAQFVHPWREDAYDEAIESARLPKYHGLPVLEQVEHYKKLGFPENSGLWAAGVIVRQHTNVIKEFGKTWLEECYKWSFQDQISEPFVLWKHALYPNSLPGTHFSNKWLSYEGSGRH